MREIFIWAVMESGAEERKCKEHEQRRKVHSNAADCKKRSAFSVCLCIQYSMWSCQFVQYGMPYIHLYILVYFPPQSRAARTSRVHTFMNRSQSMKTRFFAVSSFIPFRLVLLFLAAAAAVAATAAAAVSVQSVVVRFQWEWDYYRIQSGRMNYFYMAIRPTEWTNNRNTTNRCERKTRTNERTSEILLLIYCW